MRALTIWQPWASAIARGPKRVENRSWVPSRRQLVPGDRFAIHAGKSFDADAREGMQYGFEPWCCWHDRPPEQTAARVLPSGAVVAVARFAGCVRPADDDPWAVGPWCWVLEDVVAIAPVYCRGHQGLWHLPDEVLANVEAQLRGEAVEPSAPEQSPPKRVHLHYGKRTKNVVRRELQHAEGVALCRGHGPGPQNVLVELDAGERVVVPRGNVRRGPAPPPSPQLELFGGAS